MAVIARVIVRNTTQQQYDDLREKAGWLTDRPTGGIAHLTWWEGEDCCNVDAWDSGDALNAFAESRLGPAMAAVGITSQPEITIFEAHEVYLPEAQTITAT